MSGDFDTLRLHLRRWDGRRRRQEFLRALPRVLLAGLLATGLLALLARSRPLLTQGELALVAAGLLVLSVTAAAAVVWFRPRALAEAARIADRQFALRERATTAVEIHSGRLNVAPDLVGRQLDDTLMAAAAVDPTRQLPLTSRPADWLLPLAVLAALLALLWLPNPQETALREQRAVAEIVAEQTATLSALAEEIAADETLTEAQREALQSPLDEAIAALARPNLTREEAVAALSQAGSELRDLSRNFEEAAGGAAAEALAEATAALGGDPATAELAEALAAGEPGRAAAAAQALADSLAELSAAEQAALAERLAEAADALSESNAALAEALAEASEALGTQDVAGAQQAMAEAAASLDESAQSATAAGRAADAAEQLAAAQQAVAGGQTGESSAGTGDANGSESGGDSPAGGSSGNPGSEGGATGQGGPAPGGGHVENVFVPPTAGLEGEGQALELETQCLTDPANCGPVGGQSPADPDTQPGAGSQVPYDRVFGDYRDAAFEALAGSDIPLRLQSLVRDYFTALEP